MRTRRMSQSAVLAIVAGQVAVGASGCATATGVPSGADIGLLPDASPGGGIAGSGGVATGGGGAPPPAVGGSIGSPPGSGATTSTGGSWNVGGAGSGGFGTGGDGTGSSGGGIATGGAGGTTNPGGGSCGTRSGQRGKTVRSLTVGSMQRSYVAYLPQSANPSTPVPFVYVFHGASQTGSELYDMTEYAKLADTEGIAVVFPDGQGVSSATGTGVLAPWNVSDGALCCGLGAFAANANPVDFAFLDAIKADVLQDQCLDSQHVFATGFSMGGYFSHHVGCDRPDFRAVAPHSGGTIASLDTCKSGHMPIIIFHGDADPLIAAGCDDPTAPVQSGFPASATLWAKKNGCQATYTTIPESGTGGNNGQCYLYDGCPADGQVELCTFPTLAHAWAGAPVCQNCIGSGAGYPSATQLEWAFFKKYAW